MRFVYFVLMVLFVMSLILFLIMETNIGEAHHNQNFLCNGIEDHSKVLSYFAGFSFLLIPIFFNASFALSCRSSLIETSTMKFLPRNGQQCSSMFLYACLFISLSYLKQRVQC